MKAIISLAKRASRVSNLGASSSAAAAAAAAADEEKPAAASARSSDLAVVPVVDEDALPPSPSSYQANETRIEWCGGVPANANEEEEEDFGVVLEVANELPLAKVLVKWSLASSFTPRNDDVIMLTPDDGSPPTFRLHDGVFALASGKQAGQVYISVGGGLAVNGVKYIASYWSRYPGEVLYAQTAQARSFKHLPDLSLLPSDEARTKALEASKLANNASSMQHFGEDSFVPVAVTSSTTAALGGSNPLLAVPPQQSEFEKLLKQRQDKYTAKKKKTKPTTEEEEDAQPQPQHKPAAATAAQQDVVPLLSADLVHEVQQAFAVTNGFVFAGAGISMAAPSSSPSWWALMNDLLRATFEAVPEELAHLRKILVAGDVARQPEEIMESFYFYLKDTLLSVFELLEQGKPNANHFALAKLAKTGRVRAILTTNFDVFIERALQAEHVPYRLVVTQQEFDAYLRDGCGSSSNEFAVIKMHGSVDRPETIIAVANHYKMAFSPSKQRVLHHFLTHCPTLFLGYSGWDFEHTNYQQFWAEQAELQLAAPQPVFWLRGPGGGGPNLKTVVGRHIGSRLRVGEGLLPGFAVDVLVKFAPEAEVVVEEDGSSSPEAMVVARRAFLRDWVERNIPKIELVALLQGEVSVLNRRMQDKRQRRKQVIQDEGGIEGPLDSAAMSQLYVQLAKEAAEGKITSEEYMEQIQILSLDASFSSIVCTSAVRQALKARFIKDQKTHPLFATADQGDVDAIMNKNLFPSTLVSCVEGLPDTATADEIYDDAMAFVSKMDALAKQQGDDKPLALAKKNTLTMVSYYLRCDAAGRVEAERMIDAFAEQAAANAWDYTQIAQEVSKDLSKQIGNLAFGLVDVKPLIAYQLSQLLHNDQVDAESALCSALALQKSSLYMVGDLATLPEYLQLISLPLNSTAEKKLPAGNLERFADVCLAQGMSPSPELLAKLTNGGDKYAEAVDAFELASVELMIEALKHSQASSYWVSHATEKNGYYPKQQLMPELIAYALPKLKRLSQRPGEARNAQRLFGVLTTVAEAADDFALIKFACEESLKLTGDRVTELTPVGVPECLAYALQSRNELEASLALYVKAMDGIKSSVTRPKADAIVLQACLVQAQFDKTKALKMAFTYSPHFSTTAQVLATVGESRQLLVLQAAHWAKELGFASLDDAEDALQQNE